MLVARFYGARHAGDVEKTVHSAAIVSLIAGVVLLFVGLLGSPFMLRLLNTKEMCIRDSTITQQRKLLKFLKIDLITES